MPGVNWAKNLLLGKELTNKEMEDIPYPRLELHTHVMCKTIEVLLLLKVYLIAFSIWIKTNMTYNKSSQNMLVYIFSDYL